MAILKYFSLGGQDEKCRYSGVLELNGEILILNAGSSCLSSNLYGVQQVIPNYQILLPYKSKIKGLFIGSPREINIDSLPYLLDLFPEIPIYTNTFGSKIISSFLQRYEEQTSKKYVVKYVLSDLISEVTISPSCKAIPIKVSAMLPSSLLWAFKYTSSDYVVFADEFVISSENLPCRENQLNFLIQNLRNKVSLLLVGAQSCSTVTSFASKVSDNFSYLKRLISQLKGRLIVAIYSDDWYSLFNLSKLSYIYRYSFGIYPLYLSELFNNYLRENKLKGYSFSTFEKSEDSSAQFSRCRIIVVSGTYDSLYSNLKRIHTQEEKAISFLPEDLIVFMTHVYPERELEEISIINELAENGTQILKVPSTIVSYMAGAEDIMLLINYISPYNVVPINCFYKDYISLTKSLLHVMNTSKVYFLENGQYIDIERKNVRVVENPIPELYINNGEILELNRSTLFERKLIAQNGLVLVSLGFNSNKNILSLPEIKFLSVFASDYGLESEIISKIQSQLKVDLSKYLQLNTSIETKTLKKTIRKSVYNVLDSYIYKKPAILSLISNIN